MRERSEYTIVTFNCSPEVRWIIWREAERAKKAGKTKFLNQARAIRTLLRRAERLSKEKPTKK